MKAPKEHLKYLKDKEFKPDINTEILDKKELYFLKKYGCWMQALTKGEIKPVTEMEREFVIADVCKLNPRNFYERVWYKYVERKKIEPEYRHINIYEPQECCKH